MNDLQVMHFGSAHSKGLSGENFGSPHSKRLTEGDALFMKYYTTIDNDNQGPIETIRGKLRLTGLEAGIRVVSRAPWNCEALRSKLTSVRRAYQRRLVFLAHRRNALEHDAHDVHAVVDIDQVHYRRHQQGHPQVAPVPGKAGKTSEGGADQEVGKGPFITGGPHLFQGAAFRQGDNQGNKSSIQRH